MQILPWRKRDESVQGFRTELDDLFHRFFEEPFFTDSLTSKLPGAFRGGEMPRMNVSENEKEFRVKLEVPGVAEEDLNIDVHEGFLEISGEKKLEADEEKDDFHRREVTYGSFRRRVALPPHADTEHADARFEKGVLTIRLPKVQEPKGKRIAIQT